MRNSLPSFVLCYVAKILENRVFSRDVTAAMLVFPSNPPGIELYCHGNVFFCFGGKTTLLIT